MRTFVFTYNKMYWCVPIYAYLHNVFFSELQDVVVVGYEPMPYQLPPNFKFRSISPHSYPAKEWSTGVIQFLESVPDDNFIWSLEDYWLRRTVDHPAISSLDDYLKCHPDVWRVDLTGDRLYSGKSMDRGYWGHLDMIETGPDVPYCLSTQMSVMNRRHTLKVMKMHMKPWEFELQDQKAALGELRVMGTKQMPVRYTIGWGTGSKDEDDNPVPNTSGIPQKQLDFIRERGWLDRTRWAPDPEPDTNNDTKEDTENSNDILRFHSACATLKLG